ncbi:MAG: hypothetical protein OES09_00800 [Gammaproteobacteria bacterium]|nr:hypothetical protein [Gammaproteobacteria bacterium]
MRSRSTKWTKYFVPTSTLYKGLLGGWAEAATPGPGFGPGVAGSFLVDPRLIGTDGTPFEAQPLATLTADGGAVAIQTDDDGFGTASFFHGPKHGGTYTLTSQGVPECPDSDSGSLTLTRSG